MITTINSFKKINERSSADFIVSYAVELKEMAKQLKAIHANIEPLFLEEDTENFPPETQAIFDGIDNILSKYDKYLEKIIYDTEPYGLTQLVEWALDNEVRNGTEPQFMIYAIEEVYNFLKRKNIINEKFREGTASSFDAKIKEWSKKYKVKYEYKFKEIKNKSVPYFKLDLNFEQYEALPNNAKTELNGILRMFNVDFKYSNKNWTPIIESKTSNKSLSENLSLFKHTFDKYCKNTKENSEVKAKAQYFLDYLKKNNSTELNEWLSGQGSTIKLQDLMRSIPEWKGFGDNSKDGLLNYNAFALLDTVSGYHKNSWKFENYTDSFDDNEDYPYDFILTDGRYLWITEQDFGDMAGETNYYNTYWVSANDDIKSASQVKLKDIEKLLSPEDLQEIKSLNSDLGDSNYANSKSFVESKTNEGMFGGKQSPLPSNITDWLKRQASQEQTKSAKQVASWVIKCGSRISGGTTIGKSPQTLILDIKHNGSEISINDDGIIEFQGEEISTFKQFEKLFTEYKSSSDANKKYFKITEAAKFNDEYYMDTFEKNISGYDNAYILIVDKPISTSIKKKIENQFKVVIDKTSSNEYVVYAKDHESADLKKFVKSFLK